MKHFLLFTVLLLTVVLTLLTPIVAFADEQVVGAGEVVKPIEVNRTPQRLSPEVVTQATGRTWYDTESETQIYEYKARIDSAPSYIDGQPIDCTWHEKSATKWEAGINLFTATVTDRITSVKYENSDIVWSPQVFIGDKEYHCFTSAALLETDPINENYRNNTLSWDYGICERRLRLIEGMISETYIFKEDPGADIQIKSNAIADDNFVGECPVFAYDAAGGNIPISSDKIVKAEDLKGATYPVTIDPTEVYVTSAGDGEVYNSGLVYATQWAETTADYVQTTLLYNTIGQWDDMGWPRNYGIERLALYFDTSALPDTATITSANLYLCAYYPGTVNFSITVQNGQPIYPHNPLVVGDYDKSYYSGDGGHYNTSSGWVYETFYSISFNASGLSWISKTGTTKLLLRSDADIAGTFTGDAYAQIMSYEYGAGDRPYLEVTYTASGPPTVSTSAASYVAKTTARLNGYLNSDGGEATNVSFNYHPWYNANWSDCIEFTIDADYVDADLTNFPMLITGAQLNTTDTGFWTTVNVNGSDILFTSSNGVTKLNRELVSINTTAKTMECYVNVTSIDDTTDTKFYMYYGANVSLYNESNSKATWDTNYKMVYHMNDINTSAVGDSTVNNYLGVKRAANEPAITTGMFSGDKAQLYDGSNDYITVNTSIPPMVTAEIIVKFNNVSTTQYFLNGGDTDNKNAFQHYMQTSTRAGWRYDNVSANMYQAGSYSYSVGTWYDINTVQGGGDRRINVNDTIVVAQSTTAFTIGTVETPVVIGAYLTYISPVNGSISEVRVSSTNRSQSWLKATYYSLLSPTSFAPVTDVFTSTTTQSKNTGDSFYISQTGLTANTLYGYKTEAVNSYGTSWGEWATFTTSATSGAPTNISAYPSATTIGLTWQKGLGASETMVRYKIGAYPSSTSDGSFVYNGSSTSYTHTELIPGTNYYYRAWSDDGAGIYSANYSSVQTTTLAGKTSSGATPEAPTAPNGWFGSPDYTHMSFFPLYDVANSVADSIHMPRNTFWMGLAVLNVVFWGIVAYFLSNNNLLIAVLVSAVFIALAGTQELISWWYVGIYLIIAIVFSFKAVTR